MSYRPQLIAVLLLAIGVHADGMETITYQMQEEGKQSAAETATGRVIAEVSDGGMIFESDEGMLLFLRGNEVLSKKSDDREFASVTPEIMGERLLEELPSNYRLHTTKHYVIAYDTSREYAEWTSSLLERLHKALVAYWKKQKFDLKEPDYPLPIIIHRSFRSYQEACKKDRVGAGAVGYYNLRNNRVTMYDITGNEEFLADGSARRAGSRKEITAMLNTPIGEPLVATIVHEATHQVAYNTGIMQRFADLPIWLVEGMAVYFEAPEAGSTRGWRGIGKINYRRLETFQRNLPRWNQSSLVSIIADDARLRDPRTGGDAYADAWALNYYLIKRQPKQYVAYVKEMSQRRPFIPATQGSPKAKAAARIKLFEKHFGSISELTNELPEYFDRY